MNESLLQTSGCLRLLVVGFRGVWLFGLSVLVNAWLNIIALITDRLFTVAAHSVKYLPKHDVLY